MSAELGLLPSGVDFKDLSLKCCKAAQALHAELEALRKGGPARNRLEDAGRLFRSSAKARRIKRLCEELEDTKSIGLEGYRGH
jgi:hypothetical protein